MAGCRDEVHATLAQGASGDRGGPRRDHLAPDHARSRGRGRRDPGRRSGAVHGRRGGHGAPPPECRAAQPVRGRHWCWHARGGLRRAQCPSGHEGGVRRGRHRDPGERQAAAAGQDPRRRQLRHAVLGARAAARRGPRRDYRAGAGRAGRPSGRSGDPHRRPGDRRRGDPQSRRLLRRARHRARARRGRSRNADLARFQQGSAEI